MACCGNSYFSYASNSYAAPLSSVRTSDPCCAARVAAQKNINQSALAALDSRMATVLSAATVPTGCCCEAVAARSATATLLGQVRGLVF